MDGAAQNSEASDTPNRIEICPSCGLTRESLYRDGHMGCAVCYDTFESEVLHALWRIHGAVEHIGKA